MSKANAGLVRRPLIAYAYRAGRRPVAALLVVVLLAGAALIAIAYAGSVNAYARAPSPKVFLTLEGGPHIPFIDPWLSPTIRSISDFLDGLLDHDREALARLASDGDVPGASSLRQDMSACHWCG
jgi:fermentation-respiration switch protein FrsA (DUF1100 family)